MLLRDIVKDVKDSAYLKTGDVHHTLRMRDADPGAWYADVAQDVATEALIGLFSSNSVIEDHKDFHGLADELGIEPSVLEEKTYALLQSFFSQGRYMKEGQEKNFDPDEISMGDKVELEHTDNPVIARRIALDHLTELPDYYTRLKDAEQWSWTCPNCGKKESVNMGHGMVKGGAWKPGTTEKSMCWGCGKNTKQVITKDGDGQSLRVVVQGE
jgi:hypothetical protein